MYKNYIFMIALLWCVWLTNALHITRDEISEAEERVHQACDIDLTKALNDAYTQFKQGYSPGEAPSIKSTEFGEFESSWAPVTTARMSCQAWSNKLIGLRYEATKTLTTASATSTTSSTDSPAKLSRMSSASSTAMDLSTSGADSTTATSPSPSPTSNGAQSKGNIAAGAWNLVAWVSIIAYTL